LRMLVTPAFTRRSAASCAAAPGVATTPMFTRRVATICAAQHGAHLRLVDVDDAGDGETPLAEPAVAGECLTQVAGADDDDRPVVGETQLPADLVHEVRHFVADTTGAVAAEIAEVLAHLGRIHARQLGQTLRGDALHALVGLLAEDAQVHGQTRHGGIRNASAVAVGGHTDANVRHSCTRSQSQPSDRRPGSDVSSDTPPTSHRRRELLGEFRPGFRDGTRPERDLGRITPRIPVRTGETHPVTCGR
jgi:hypothetical protein